MPITTGVRPFSECCRQTDNRDNILSCIRYPCCSPKNKYDNKNNRDNFLGCTRCSSCRYIKKHDNKNNRDNMLHGIRCPCCPCCRQNYSAFHSYGLPAVRRTFSPAALQTGVEFDHPGGGSIPCRCRGVPPRCSSGGAPAAAGREACVSGTPV